MEDNNATMGNDRGNATAAGGNGGNADAGTSSFVLATSNAPTHYDDAINNNADNDNATGEKTLVSAVAGSLVALVAIALSAAFVYGRRCHRSGKNDNGCGGKDFAKEVPVLMLVNDNVENLCNGGGNNDGNAYHKMYYGAAGGSAVGGDLGGKDAPGPADV
jgi:hypothetical protein